MMANGGKLLEMKIKTPNTKLIDSCYFIAMPLSRFSDIFNIPHPKGTILALRYYDPNGMKK